MPPKKSPWILCEICNTTFTSKAEEIHSNHCPIDMNNIQHECIYNSTLYGNFELKPNEEIKNVSMHDRDYLVFVSVNAMQLCDLSIGETALVENLDGSVKLVRNSWPTTEKTLTSVLLTKNCADVANLQPNQILKVSKFEKPTKDAITIAVRCLNAPKLLDLNKELLNRLQKLHIDKIINDKNVLSCFWYGKVLQFSIENIELSELSDQLDNLSLEDTKYLKITEKTRFLFNRTENITSKIKAANSETIGGLRFILDELKALFNMMIKPQQQLENIHAITTILLHGHSGCGKTMLATAFAANLKNVAIRYISSYDLYANSGSNLSEEIKKVFDTAVETSPSVLIIDEIDLLCGSSKSRNVESEKRLNAAMQLYLDSILNKKVFLIGITNKLDQIDSVFRRVGRFEREIEVPAPNPSARQEILMKMLQNDCVGFDEVEVNDLAEKTHGYVGADLKLVISQAAVNANRARRGILTKQDFDFALKMVQPSAMREVQIETPNILWSDIGGNEHLKLILQQCIYWPIKHSASFKRLGVTPPKGVLMYGPPGCSKTMIAKALATESRLNFLSIKGPELFSKFVGDSEKAVRDLFRKARQVAPSIIFFDELDALGTERGMSNSASNNVQERVLAQLLTELDGVEVLNDVVVLAATNRPDRIDKALLRPGRLDRIVYVPLPDNDTRRDIFKIKFQKMPVLNVDVEQLINVTEGYSGAEVNAVCHEAAMSALEEDIDARHIEMKHFEKALKMITPRTPQSLLDIYEQYS